MNPAIAIFERMDCHEPQMRHTRLEHEVSRTLLFKPVEEFLHFPAETDGHWSFIMNALLPDRPRNNLHGALLVVSPGAHIDPGHSASAGRKQGGVPVKQSLGY